MFLIRSRVSIVGRDGVLFLRVESRRGEQLVDLRREIPKGVLDVGMPGTLLKLPRRILRTSRTRITDRLSV